MLCDGFPALVGHGGLIDRVACSLCNLAASPSPAPALLQAANSNPDDSDRYCTLPKDLEQQLMPFQVQGLMR